MKREEVVSCQTSASSVEPLSVVSGEDMASRRCAFSFTASGFWLLASGRHSTFRRAFSFAEILFAVMILGIGFIMVAAMFPVAIRQTQSTVEDVNGVAEAHRGQAILK